MFDAVFIRASFIDMHFDWKTINNMEMVLIQKEQEQRFLEAEKQDRRRRYDKKLPNLKADFNR